MAFALIPCFTLSLTAARYEISPTASKDAIWFFEIKNKDQKNDIWIELFDRDGNQLDIEQSKVKKAEGSQEKKQGYLRIEGLDPDKEYTLYIYKKDPKQGAFAESVWDIMPSKFREGIFVKYQNGKLSPQEGGSFKSKLTGTFISQSGVELRKNISPSEIKKGVYKPGKIKEGTSYE